MRAWHPSQSLTEVWFPSPLPIYTYDLLWHSLSRIKCLSTLHPLNSNQSSACGCSASGVQRLFFVANALGGPASEVTAVPEEGSLLRAQH